MTKIKENKLDRLLLISVCLIGRFVLTIIDARYPAGSLVFAVINNLALIFLFWAVVLKTPREYSKASELFVFIPVVFYTVFYLPEYFNVVSFWQQLMCSLFLLALVFAVFYSIEWFFIILGAVGVACSLEYAPLYIPVSALTAFLLLSRHSFSPPVKGKKSASEKSGGMPLYIIPIIIVLCGAVGVVLGAVKNKPGFPTSDFFKQLGNASLAMLPFIALFLFVAFGCAHAASNRRMRSFFCFLGVLPIITVVLYILTGETASGVFSALFTCVMSGFGVLLTAIYIGESTVLGFIKSKQRLFEAFCILSLLWFILFIRLFPDYRIW